MKLSLTEQLSYTTVRIQTNTGTGTGFFYKFAEQSDGSHIPVIITNKHVVKGALASNFLLTAADESGHPIDTEHIPVRIVNLPDTVVNHPNPEIDLCAIPIGDIFNQAKQSKKSIFYRTLDNSLVPTTEDLNDMHAIEDIIMIGYPIGLWDATNNMPIFRRGITASHPKKDWQGRPETLIDAACFPGSSGSPVFINSERMGVKAMNKNSISIGQRIFKFIGILYGGPQYTANGKIEVVDVPTIEKHVALTSMPLNLGVIIKSSELVELDKIFVSRRK